MTSGFRSQMPSAATPPAVAVAVRLQQINIPTIATAPNVAASRVLLGLSSISLRAA